MHILIIRNAQVYDFGGGERFPVNLAVELRSNNIDSTVISRSPKLLKYAVACNVPAVRGWWWSRQNWSGRHALLFPAYVFWQLILFFWYIQLLLKLRPDVVHPQSKDDFIAATLAGRLLQKKVIWTDHADLKYIFANHQVWYKNPVGKLVYLVSKLANTITLVSYSEYDLISDALGHAPDKRFVVIHNGIKETAIKAHERSDQDVGLSIFCATSRLVTAKGIGELIDAFATVYSKHKNTALWLVGDGPDEVKFRQQAKGITGVRFIGFSEQALAYVASADYFVHPSYHEGFSLSLVEAAMLAKPIIACNVGGNPEIIINSKTGLLVPAKDSSSLAEAMSKLLDDDDLAQALAKNARDLFEQSFQFDKIVAEKFVPLYEK